MRKAPQSNQARQLRFHTDSDQNGLRLMGEIYPLRIHDTYALDLTLRYRETLNKSSEAYHSLLNLLGCRSKILYAYSQSRHCNYENWKLYSQLEQKVEELIQPPEETLEDLKQWLKLIPHMEFHYAKYLRDIQDHTTTITTNIQNYTSKLEKIKELTLPNDDLAFLQNFLDYNCKQFQNQIQVDLNYLKPGQNLFEQMTSTIRGIIEVKQTESDRNLEQTLKTNEIKAQKREKKLELAVVLVGTGLAVSGISSQVAPNPTEQIPLVSKETNLASYFGYSALDMVFHILLGVMITIPVGIIVCWWQRSSKSD